MTIITHDKSSSWMRPEPVPLRPLLKIRPDQFVSLLLRTALAPDDQALAAWAQWKATRNLDDASWAEVRLLATLPERLRQIDPGYEFLARLQGFRRYIFTHAHRTLNGTRPMMEALHRAGIEMMLLKGAARLAQEPSLAAERYVSDIDVLVRVEDWDRALEVARSEGWSALLPHDAPADRTAAKLFAFTHSLDFESEGGKGAGRLDLHHHARHMCRYPGDDDALWAHCTRAQFLGVPVLLPSPTDQVLVSLAHALRHSKATPAGDWALDLAGILSGGKMDWKRLRQAAIASNTQAFVASALLFARRDLKLDVPQTVTKGLVAAVTDTHLGELAYLSRAHYWSLRFPYLALLARDAATLRANAAARRQKAKLAPSSGPLPRGELSHTEGSRLFARIAVPPGLRATDRPALEARFRVGPGTARVAIVSIHRFSRQ